MRVVLVLVLLVGAFLLGGWADHVYFLTPIGSSGAGLAPSPGSASNGVASNAPPPAAAATPDAAPTGSSDLRSCLAEAAARHLEPAYARRMCQDIVSN